MRIYIFDSVPFLADYGNGFAFAIANSEEEAKQMIIDSRGNSYQTVDSVDWGPVVAEEIQPGVCRHITGTA